MSGNDDTASRDAEAIPLDAAVQSSDPRLYPKRRVAVACNVCRLRKTRCDAAKPTCGFCKTIGAQCTWPDNRTSKQAVVSADGLAALERRLVDVEQKLETFSQARWSVSSHGESPMLSSPQTSVTSDSTRLVDRRPLLAGAAVDFSFLTRQSPQNPSQDFAFRQTQAEAMTARPSLLTFRSPPFLKVKSWDDTAEFYEDGMRTGEWFHRQFELLDSQAPDLTSRTTRRLQQRSFENCLTWTPLFDQATCVEIWNRAYASSFAPSDISSCLAVLLFALGEISDHAGTITEEIPGMVYFAYGSRMLERFSMRTGSIPVLQCRILQASYFKFAICPLQAWNAITPAARDCMHVLSSRNWSTMNEDDRESMIRAFWATSVILHELEATMKMHPIGLKQFHEVVPLPRFEDEDLAFYYFLAQVSLRKFLTNTLEVVGYHAGRVINAPVVTSELRHQAREWYNHLPSAIRFPLDATPLFDPRKSFLRGQFFALFIVLNWTSVLQVMELCSQMPDEAMNPKISDTTKERAQECITISILYISVAEEQLMGRKMGTHFSLWATYAMLAMLLITYNSPSLAFIPETRQPQHIRIAYDLLEPWKTIPMVRRGLERARRMMDEAGI